MGPTYLLGERQKNWGMKENVFMGREEFGVGNKNGRGKLNRIGGDIENLSVALLSSAQLKNLDMALLNKA